MVLKSGKQLCAKPECRRVALRNGVGLCYAHDPVMREKRQAAFVKRGTPNRHWVPAPEKSCAVEGCNEWPMRDGSGFCYAHNPAQAEKHKEWALMQAERRIKRAVEKPAKRRCQVKGCQAWMMKDGAGFCYHHHPELKEKRHKSRLGRHIPWMGLENMKEARGLLFYSLETDQPLLTLRALTKIVSLHRQERLAKAERVLAAEPLAKEAATRETLREEGEGEGDG